MSTPAATAAGSVGPGAARGWLPWVLLAAVLLPFHPLWIDFEQVRRGLLLLAAGACLLALPRLPRVRGEAVLLALVAGLAASGGVQWLLQTLRADAGHPVSFQPWEAGYRLLHWLSLWVVLRAGAAAGTTGLPAFASALAATSLFGLLQRLGLGAIEGYGVEREPVSLFGNGNVAAEWTAIAAMLVAAAADRTAAPRHRALGDAALGLAAAYLVVNQSRSGLLALPAGLLLLAWLRRRHGGVRPLAVAAGGALVGWLLSVAAPLPPPADAAAARAAQQRAVATLQVRLEIAKGASRLIAESPLLGHGPGQFVVHYPRVRSAAEIEASSQGRQFATEVRTAHDDWLELLVEGGAPAFVLFAALVFVLQRRHPDRARLLPLFVLLLLMFVRAPLGNAPAAVAALWLVGRTDERPRPPARWRRPLAVLLGLVLIAAGALPVAGNTAFVPYVRAQAAGVQPPVGAARAAAACMPFEPRWFEVLAREQLFAGDLAQAAHHAARALRLRPHHPELHVLLGEVLARGGRLGEATAVAEQALRLDPSHPELRVLRSAALAQQGRIDEAIAAVVVDPHPVLRAQLAAHFRSLAEVCRQRGLADGAARLRAEHHFLAAADRLGRTDAESLAATGEHVRALFQALQDAGALRTDLRPYVVSALHLLDLGKPDAAADLGEPAARHGGALAAWQKQLLGEQLARLEALPAWRPALQR